MLVKVWVDIRTLADRFFELGVFLGRKLLGRPVMEMHGVDRQSAVNHIRDSGGGLIHMERDYWSGPHWLSYTYYITK